MSGHHAAGPPAHPAPGTWADHGDASGARRRCCSRSPRCAPGTCSGQYRPASGGRVCEAGHRTPCPPPDTHPPTGQPTRRTHRPVEVAPAVHGHVEAGVHSLEGHDAHADGADLNDAWGGTLGGSVRTCSPPSTHPRVLAGSFIQVTFTKHLLCAWPCAGCADTREHPKNGGVMEGQEGHSSQCEGLRQDGPCQVGGRQRGGAGLLGATAKLEARSREGSGEVKLEKTKPEQAGDCLGTSEACDSRRPHNRGNAGRAWPPALAVLGDRRRSSRWEPWPRQQGEAGHGGRRDAGGGGTGGVDSTEPLAPQ